MWRLHRPLREPVEAISASPMLRYSGLPPPPAGCYRILPSHSGATFREGALSACLREAEQSDQVA